MGSCLNDREALFDQSLLPIILVLKSNVTAKSYKRPASCLKLIALAILMWFLFVACFNIVSVGKVFHSPAQL